MCLIIYNSNGTKVPENHIRTAYENNPHGFGVMWAQDGHVHTYRDLLDGNEIVKLMNELEGIPYVVHFRYRTRGPISSEMAHPHRVLSHKTDGHDLYMMHNGTFLFLKTNEEESDSAKFAKQLRGALRVYGPDSLFDKGQLARMASRVGAMNKIVFLRGDGKIALVNKNAGWQDGALWYSNTYSLEPDYRTISKHKTKKNNSIKENPLVKKLNDSLLLDRAYAYNKEEHNSKGKNILHINPNQDDHQTDVLTPRNQKKNKNGKKNEKKKLLVLEKTKLSGNRSLVHFKDFAETSNK